ncbi:MAG: hypothetical protein DMG68_20295 [Acidobacteria bacterium]|nr:MAG: hypothetical protein DMG68_20295 [Acidobacteriota bacterium]
MPQNRHYFSADHDACGVGFIAQLGSAGSHEVVERALTALARLAHRGGVDADGRSGDGAGLLTAIPQSFIRRSAGEAGLDLPDHFGLGMVFLRGKKELTAVSSGSPAHLDCSASAGAPYRSIPLSSARAHWSRSPPFIKFF